MLQNMDRLKVFYYVYSEGSVLAAAQTLHVSQSAISQSLQKLESEIQSALFTRTHKRLIPTTAGQYLFSVVRPLIAELDICLKNIEKSKDQPFGKLQIGAPVEFGKAYFPAILARFREKYPDVTFYLKLGDLGTLLPLVETGQIDFAFVDVFLTQKEFSSKLDMYHFTPVVEEEVILACSSKYYQNSVKKNHSFKHLIQRDFITYRNNARAVKNWFKHHFDKYHVKFHVVLTVDSQQAVISAISHHAGMGVIASHQVKKEIEEGLIIPIDTSKPQIINQISLVQLQDKIPTLTEKIFQQFLLDEIQSINL